MDRKKNARVFSGHARWALPLAAVAAYAANPILGLAAGVTLAVLWISERRSAAAYNIGGHAEGAGEGAPSKREVMRCWMLMF